MYLHDLHGRARVHAEVVAGRYCTPYTGLFYWDKCRKRYIVRRLVILNHGKLSTCQLPHLGWTMCRKILFQLSMCY
jgi:hypothetical protein